MKLATEFSFLTLEVPNGASSHIVRVVPSLNAVFRRWAPSTRVSPIFGINSLGTASSRRINFEGSHYLIFMGPVHPERVLECCGKKCKVWLSLGLFNVLILTPTIEDKNTVLKWARKENLRYEVWTIKDGRVLNVNFSRPSNGSNGWRRELATLYTSHLSPELHQAIRDYCPLMATTLSRSEQLPKELLDDLLNINQFVSDVINDYENEGQDGSPYPTLGQVLTIHAGLTRFTAQTFSGTSQIFETECHLRSHSLLGIGVASLGLAHLREFMQSTLGAARLPERFALLGAVNKDVPNLCKLKIKDDFWMRDHLGTSKVPEISAMPQIPLLSYFSARDGFKSTLTTISAPLSTISACNSIQWSLLTITHELSHVIIRSILSELYPNFESEEEVNAALDLLDKGQEGSNLLEEIRRLLLITIIAMDNVAAGREESIDIDEETLVALLEQWYREVQEIFVHAFDFLYFYGGDIEKYIEGIWISWGTIPNINNRIHEYVVRTICTALLNHLRRPKAEEVARDQVTRCLTNLVKDGSGGTYVKRALEYINNHWDDEIMLRVIARKDLVKIVRAFLFSEKIATNVRGETELKGGESSDKEGYNLKVGSLELREIRNPFRFIEFYTRSKTPSATESAWMLYVLAFYVQINAK